MAKPKSPQGLLTVQQAAAYASCSESTIKRRIRSGELPAQTFGSGGRKYYIAADDLESVFRKTHFGQSEAERLQELAAAVAAQAPALDEESRARLRALLA